MTENLDLQPFPLFIKHNWKGLPRQWESVKLAPLCCRWFLIMSLTREQHSGDPMRPQLGNPSPGSASTTVTFSNKKKRWWDGGNSRHTLHSWTCRHTIIHKYMDTWSINKIIHLKVDEECVIMEISGTHISLAMQRRSFLMKSDCCQEASSLEKPKRRSQALPTYTVQHVIPEWIITGGRWK